MTDTFRHICAELVDIVTAHCNPDDYAVGYCAAVLTRARAALAEGAGVGVTDEELDDWLQNHPEVGLPEAEAHNVAYPPIGEAEMRAVIRDALAQWGTTHPRPIPVAERLPTAADCDAEGRCWWFHPGCEVTTPFWYLADCEYPDRATPYDPSAWLPAAAIPMPEATP